jgi:hypothetical protein
VNITALILWIITAGGGFYLLTTWLRHGGPRRPPAGNSRFPPGLIFGHFALAAVGLIVWIIFVAVAQSALAWTAFVLLAVVAGLGFTMLARWIPTYRALRPDQAATASGAVPAERHFPVAVVVAHGVLGAATLLLVLLIAL